MRVVALLIAGAALAPGCGGSEQDDVRAAVERFNAAFREGDSAAWCASVVPDALLPDPVLQALPVEGGQSGSLRDVEAFQRQCSDRDALDDVSARVRARAATQVPDDVEILDVAPTEGLDAAAIAGSGETPWALVRIDGEWLVVFDSR